MRKKIIAGNWKMNKTPAQAADFAAELSHKLVDAKADVVFCVPFTHIPAVMDAVVGTKVAVGAQNMHEAEFGAYTGEISADMLLDLGVNYVIIGHSERRQYFHESDALINRKTIVAINKGLTPIVCVGEKLEQRELGITTELVRLQTKIALNGLSSREAERVIVAYEPIWAIGTGKVATNEQAEEVCAAIRVVLAEMYSQETADKIRLQYGGSVTPDSAAGLFAQPNIDGGLVGGASLKLDFERIVNGQYSELT